MGQCVITIWFLCLCVLSFVHSAVITRVSPESFNVGLTRNLTVECETSREDNPNMAYLISISLYHSTEMNQSEYSYLASMNSFHSSVQTEETDKSNGRYFGNIDNKNKSFLRVVWEYPKINRGGHYKCEASGINLMGKPLSLSSTALVKAVQPIQEHIVDKIQTLFRWVEKLQNGLNAAENSLNLLNNFKNLTSSRLEASRNSLFIPSPPFQGRRYWLTKKPLGINSFLANSVCELHGGYLAEIDSAEEFSFIRESLVRKGLFKGVITGASDEDQEGVWINRHSGTRVKSFNWGPHEPNGGRNENCQSFWFYTNSWYLNDLGCSVADAGFICEIPE